MDWSSRISLSSGTLASETSTLLSRGRPFWPPAERGRAYGIFIGFVYLGVAFGMPLVGWLIKLWDWRAMFYISAVLTLGLVALFCVQAVLYNVKLLFGFVTQSAAILKALS